MADTCPHKLLKRQNSGGVSWYVCANPECPQKFQKFKAVEWDGKAKVISKARGK